MKIDGKMKYSFELTARELTHIRHALNLATENSEGTKSKEFKRIHDELTNQVNGTLKAFKQHFDAMLTMSVSENKE